MNKQFLLNLSTPWDCESTPKGNKNICNIFGGGGGGLLNKVLDPIFGSPDAPQIDAPSAESYGFSQEDFDDAKLDRKNLVGQLSGYEDLFRGTFNEQTGKYEGGLMQGMQGLRGQVPGLAGGYGTAQTTATGSAVDGTGLAGVQSGLNTLRSGVGATALGFGTQGTELSGLQSESEKMRSGLQGELSGLSGTYGELQNLQQRLSSDDPFAKETAVAQGELEMSRRSSQEAARERMRRNIAQGGNNSPQAMAALEANLADQNIEGASQDQLRAYSMGQQRGQANIGLQSNMLNQLAAGRRDLAGQLGDSLGRDQSLIGQRSALTGQQIGALQTQAGMQGQLADTIMKQYGIDSGTTDKRLAAINQQAGLMGQEANMTNQAAGFLTARLQDAVARQNALQQARLAAVSGQQQANMTNAQLKASKKSALDNAVAVGTVAAKAYASDINLKTNIKEVPESLLPNKSDVFEFLDALKPYYYEYKNPERFGQGSRMGIMAQDLEKTKLGKDLVIDTPEGKLVDIGKGLGVALASLSVLRT